MSQSPLPRCVVVIPAGGVGTRMQSAVPKQFLDIQGIPIIIRTIQTAAAVPAVRHVVVATLPSHMTYLAELLDTYALDHCTSIVEGGTDRRSSVARALEHREVASADVVLVHDAVRPFASCGLFERVIEAAHSHGCAVPVLPVTDTIKVVDATGAVVETLDRSTLRAAQTPQGFRTEILLRAHASYDSVNGTVTDDAMLCERNAVDVMTVDGEVKNVKITKPEDIAWAQSLVD